MKETDCHGARRTARGRSGSGARRPADSRRPRLAAMSLALLLCAIAPGNARGQDSLVDRVVAIVGDSVVLLSDIIQDERQLEAQRGALPPEGSPQRDSIRRGIIDRIVEVQIILQAAARDTLLEVEEEQVEEALNGVMAQVESSFPNRAELERALATQGMTLQSLREMRREQIRQQQLVRLYVQTNIGQGAVEVTEDEIRDFFEAGRAGFGERPATVTFRQVLMRVLPSDSGQAAARSRAEDILQRARSGEDFAELAGAYSQDPGSAPAGGDLGWFRRGQGMATEFEEAAFSLPEGALSEVVETEFGFHVILLERIRGAERSVRHILIRPVTDYSDISRARGLAEDIAERAQSEDFQALVDDYHDSEIPDSFTVPTREVAQGFPPAYLAALGQREAGEIVGPVEFTFRERQHVPAFGIVMPGEYFAVIRIVEVREAGDYTYEDLKESIRGTLIDQKRFEALVDGLRANTYVEIKGF